MGQMIQMRMTNQMIQMRMTNQVNNAKRALIAKTTNHARKVFARMTNQMNQMSLMRINLMRTNQMSLMRINQMSLMRINRMSLTRTNQMSLMRINRMSLMRINQMSLMRINQMSLMRINRMRINRMSLMRTNQTRTSPMKSLEKRSVTRGEIAKTSRNVSKEFVRMSDEMKMTSLMNQMKMTSQMIQMRTTNQRKEQRNVRQIQTAPAPGHARIINVRKLQLHQIQLSLRKSTTRLHLREANTTTSRRKLVRPPFQVPQQNGSTCRMLSHQGPLPLQF